MGEVEKMTEAGRGQSWGEVRRGEEWRRRRVIWEGKEQGRELCGGHRGRGKESRNGRGGQTV